MKCRAIRRHHHERLKLKRLDYYGGWMKTSNEPNIKRRIGMATDTPKPCSKPECCGTPRVVKAKYKFNYLMRE